MRNAVDRIPEEVLVTADAWNMILTEILGMLKPYLEIEVEVLIEETIFTVEKKPK